MKIARVVLILLLFSLPAVAAEEMSPVKDQGGPNIANLRLLLNSFGALGDGYVENVLRDLRTLSATDEVRSGEWDKMRGLLEQFSRSGIKAAAVWFARPDGSYYTVGKGLTDLNLSDRAYFPRLMAGKEISGDLVISKFTGKRSAIVAVPVKKDGKVMGALGTSLAVEDISRLLDEEMGLPRDIIFYALDERGQTCLHRISPLLFAYPSDMGSKSLAHGVGEMLAKSEGVVRYDFYGGRLVVFKKFPVTGWVFAIAVITGGPAQPGTELPPILSDFEKMITAELGKMDRDLAELAGRLSVRDLKTAETRRMLDDLCRSYPYAVDCAIVDPSGRMVMIEPKAYAEFEDSDISSQEQVIRLQKTKRPVLSDTFKTVEGIEAADLEYPVFSSRGDFAGSVSVLIRPDALFSHILGPVLHGMPVEAFVMQTDGRILYDEDKEEVGRMLFTDPMYKPFSQLIAVGTMISKEKTGSGSYDFMQKGMKKPVKKDAYWTTVGLHGTEWRLIVMHIRTGNGEGPARPGAGSYDDALRTLAEDAGMKKALSGNDDAKIRDTFKGFYAEHAGLYSIQWLDAQGKNRYGYPEENSLINLDMRTLNIPSAKPMLRTLSDKKESAFVSPLAEGKTGLFFMVPVFEGQDYLGMIYTIRLKE